MDSLKRCVAAALLLVIVAPSPCAQAAPGAAADVGGRAAAEAERAEELFRRGTRAFEEQRYSDAYGALRAAWDLAPSYRTAAGLGQVELHLAQYRDAAEHLSYCLRHYPADGDVRGRTHVEEGLEQARERVAALRVRVNVEGADVAVDGRAIGVSPLDGLIFVEPGSHEVTASRSGQVARAQVEGRVRATEEVTLTLPVPAAPAAAPLPPAATPAAGPVEPLDDGTAAPSGGPRPSTWALVVGGSLTAAALGTSLAFHFKAQSADDDAATLKNTLEGGGSVCPAASGCAALADKLDERNGANGVALGAAIGSGVFAVATAVTYFALRSSERSSAAAPPPLAVGWRAEAGGALISLRGGF